MRRFPPEHRHTRRSADAAPNRVRPRSGSDSPHLRSRALKLPGPESFSADDLFRPLKRVDTRTLPLELRNPRLHASPIFPGGASF